MQNHFVAAMKSQIVRGKSPAIVYADRKWNAQSSGINIATEPPKEVNRKECIV